VISARIIKELIPRFWVLAALADQLLSLLANTVHPLGQRR